MSYRITPETSGGGGGGFPGYGAVGPVGTVTSNGVSLLVSRADHVHAHDNLPGGTLHADVIAGGASGFMTGADKTKLDGIAPGATATPLSAVAAATVGTVNAVGVGTSAARDDHVHAHGAQTDGTLHAVVTALANGFMSSAMLATLIGVTPFQVDIPVDFGSDNGGGDFVEVTQAAAAVTATSVFQKPIILPNAADHDPEDVLLEEMDAIVNTFGVGTVTINCSAPNMTWGRYTVRLIGYNP